MFRVRNRRALRTGDLRHELVGDLVDVAHVLVAGDYERGDSNLGESRRNRWFESLRTEVVLPGLELECLPFHVREMRANLRIVVFGQPHSQVRFDGSFEVAALERI